MTSLDYSVDENPSTEFPGAQVILTALQQQLGPKLESKKTLFDMIIVDRVEKIPAENCAASGVSSSRTVFRVCDIESGAFQYA
jgi:hypothetical protein